MNKWTERLKLFVSLPAIFLEWIVESLKKGEELAKDFKDGKDPYE